MCLFTRLCYLQLSAFKQVWILMWLNMFSLIQVVPCGWFHSGIKNTCSQSHSFLQQYKHISWHKDIKWSYTQHLVLNSIICSDNIITPWVMVQLDFSLRVSWMVLPGYPLWVTILQALDSHAVIGWNWSSLFWHRFLALIWDYAARINTKLHLSMLQS